MSTITASDGLNYSLFSLGIRSLGDIEDSSEYNTLDVPLSDGYRAGILCGFTAGNRSWKFTMPTLAGNSILSETLTGATFTVNSREAYIRALYAENKIGGVPFVLTDPQSGTNYFADFVDEQLSLKRMRVKIYSTGLEIRQRRMYGVTV